MTASPSTRPDGLDAERVDEFAGSIFATVSSAVVTLMIDLGVRTGLFDALTAGAGSSAELAERAGLAERYVRECLSGLATAGIVEYDPGTRTFTLPAEHAVCLTGAGSENLAPLARVASLLGPHIPALATVFRTGGGVPYEAFRPEFTEVMDSLSRGLMDGQLLTGILPLSPGLTDRLAAGVRAADVGCGTGHALNLMAQAFPASTFLGYDFSVEAIEAGRKEAAEMGLGNARFEVQDVTTLPIEPALEVVFAFDSIHDQKDPAAVLASIYAALTPGGEFVMMDIKANSDLGANLDHPFAPFLYGISTMHCMTVSLALDGAGLGAVWGEQTARQMLSDAGFTDVSVHDVPDDPMDSIYLAAKPR